MANIERTPTVGIVVLRPPEVLLIKHGEAASHITGTIGTPGGRPEPGESLVEAAKRELEEETGLGVKIEDLHEIPDKYDADFARKDGSILHSHHTVFATSKFIGEIKGSDETMPMWVPVKALADMNLMPNTLEMIESAREVLNERGL